MNGYNYKYNIKYSFMRNRAFGIVHSAFMLLNIILQFVQAKPLPLGCAMRPPPPNPL